MTTNDGIFRTTRWTRVMQARGDSEESKLALSELCETYYQPVHAFIRFSWKTKDADELTQAFFARLLERAGLDKVDPERGRFRSYLLGAVKHFVRDEYVKAQAEKRNASGESVEINKAQSELAEPAPSDVLFDREWAIALIGRALKVVERNHTSKLPFKVLSPWLSSSAIDLSQSDAATDLGITEGALKVAIHRLRKRFRQCVREEIKQTVATEREISEELNYLIEVLTN